MLVVRSVILAGILLERRQICRTNIKTECRQHIDGIKPKHRHRIDSTKTKQSWNIGGTYTECRFPGNITRTRMEFKQNMAGTYPTEHKQKNILHIWVQKEFFSSASLAHFSCKCLFYQGSTPSGVLPLADCSCIRPGIKFGHQMEPQNVSSSFA